ncbi:decorin-binding protein DbpA (plasmid) [Borreliella garinii]|uniref:decorin-binding protein DbpA n=1 Tax=Borreliella garinii TaxID=29519 RepID=UPI002B4BC5A8|nr:decorin-binding protein DbpA [Borreliella garinii]WRM49154.1 decorin-binding protein DbpA [Borreliella garinii]
MAKNKILARPNICNLMFIKRFYLNLNSKERGYSMTKYIKNILKLSLIVSLLIACSLTGKARLESSVKDIADEIDKAIKEAKAEGVNVDAFKEKQTGGRVAGPKIKEAKIRVAALTDKFLKETEEEVIKFKENGAREDEFLEIYNLIYKTSKAVEDIGMQKMAETVTQAAEENPKTTAEGIIGIIKKFREKVQKITGKQAAEPNKKKK